MSLWLQSPCFSLPPHELSHESHTIHWDLLLENVLWCTGHEAAKPKEFCPLDEKVQVRYGDAQYLEKLNKRWIKCQRAAYLAHLCHFSYITLTNLPSLDRASVFTSVWRKQWLPCMHLVMLCDAELVKYCSLPQGKRELPSSWSTLHHLRRQMCSVLSCRPHKGRVLLFLFVVLVLLTENNRSHLHIILLASAACTVKWENVPTVFGFPICGRNFQMLLNSTSTLGMALWVSG